MKPTRVRHIILGLTVAAYMITYMDRVVIAAAAPVIQKEFAFDMVTMGWILSSFRLSYALFQIPSGWMGDRVGPRRALTWIVTSGSYRVVAMNSGAAAPVAFAGGFDLTIPHLFAIGIGLLVGGIVLLLAAIALIVLGARAGPRPPSRPVPDMAPGP